VRVDGDRAAGDGHDDHGHADDHDDADDHDHADDHGRAGDDHDRDAHGHHHGRRDDDDGDDHGRRDDHDGHDDGDGHHGHEHHGHDAGDDHDGRHAVAATAASTLIRTSGPSGARSPHPEYPRTGDASGVSDSDTSAMALRPPVGVRG
jgi:hypothetical protein